MKFSILSVAALMATATATAIPTPAEALSVLEARAGACTNAGVDNLLLHTSIEDFEKARNAKNPSGCDWSSDNCSSSPDKPDGYNFIPSCQRHDFGYRNTKKQNRFKEMKTKIDDNFHNDLYKYCSQFHGLSSWKGVECRRLADIYVAAVRKFGKREEDEVEESE
ncbi:Putative Secretory phospholipase A2 [[Torrubiella] hemipterigena]|uniref:Putative Secretory phospholipase A2 n=1 Tax=[Torrubiella] hemipterigena TaxID=1531966 RepID=A0A0A1STM9_9HYPO|nr:Putative Secretory phospholipase A2 [[Torrubiella] hemipterigena]